MEKGKPTHVTLDNNDGRQETTTESGTTHDTNFTIFQPMLKGETVQKHATIYENLSLLPDIEEFKEIPEYNIGQRKSPPLFPSHVDNTNCDELEKSLKKDLIWAVMIGIGDTGDEFKLIGSWTDFKKKTTNVEYEKSLLEYLPAIPETPKYPVCKKFLDDLLGLMEDLELGHIYAHGDEQVYALLTHIMWEDTSLYKNVIILMGGFHQLRVRQKTIHKRHAVKGYQS